MHDDARIPILLDDEVAVEADQASDGRGNAATIEEDGTLRIVLPVEQPCDPAMEGEIAVCARSPQLEASAAPPPEKPAASNPLQIRLGNNATLGPQVAASQGAAGGSGVEAKVTLRIVF